MQVMNGPYGYPPGSFGPTLSPAPYAPQPSGGYGGAYPSSHYHAYGATPSYAPPAYFGYQQPPRMAYADSPVGTGAPTLKWVVLGSFLGIFVFSLLGGAVTGLSETADDTAATIGGILTMLSVPLMITYAVTMLVWIFKSWEMLPMSMRVLNNGTTVTPGQAVGRLFIPFYNLYWYFAGATGLANAYNRALASHGSTKRASGGLAIAAAVFQVIPYANLVIAPFLWLGFMFSVEGAKKELARVTGAPY